MMSCYSYSLCILLSNFISNIKIMAAQLKINIIPINFLSFASVIIIDFAFMDQGNLYNFLILKFYTMNFSFQYYVDLGGNQIAHIFINQQSDPYVEASKFCAKQSLPSQLVTLLGDDIQQQMSKERELTLQNKLNSQQKSNKTTLQTFSNCNTMTTEFKDQTVDYLELLQQRRQSTHLQISVLQKQSVFQNLYNNYKEIEMKKQLSRKKSFQSIPFRPQINHHSDQIVRNKRKLSQSTNKVNQKKLQQTRKSNISLTPKISYNVTLVNKLGQNIIKREDNQSLYRRGQMYNKKSEEKRNKLRKSLQNKLMENCSFKPKINKIL